MRDSEFKFPTLEITSISFTGLVTIGFSEPFIELDDTSKLKNVTSDINGVERNNVELKIISLDGNDDLKELNFTWSVESFTENKLLLQLKFEDPTVVSSGFESDKFQFIVWK